MRARWWARLTSAIGATGSAPASALGMLRADLNEPGTGVEVEVFGTRYPAVVQGDGAIWDPKNDRLRA
jgi:glycine cleavage system aminomethyltransferase T